MNKSLDFSIRVTRLAVCLNLSGDVQNARPSALAFGVFTLNVVCPIRVLYQQQK